MNAPSKQQLIAMLYSWISQRPGLEFANYGDVSAYRSEVRRIGQQLQDARQLLRAVELSSISAEELAAAFPRAYSGRLSLELHSDGETWSLSYCTGQYWPTEYRAAACAVLASTLWAHKRNNCMPAAEYVVGGKRKFATMEEATAYAETLAPVVASIEERYQGKTAGDWMRSSFRRDFGRSIQSRWFD